METFNPKNGQIYTEVVQSSTRSMVPSAWKKRITGRNVDPRTARHVKGADSLQEMAMRVCCWTDLFTPEALAYPGWVYASKIYERLKSRDALSFETWMLFQEAYPDQPELSHHFRLEMHDALTCWSSIIRTLSGLNTSVLTHFCANGLYLDLAKLISMTEIPTLTALIHANPSQRQTHPLRGNAIRDWCRAVREKKAFPKLKLLYMSSIPDEGPFDNVILDHLSSFPALSLVGIERSSPNTRIRNSEKHGQWQRSSPARERNLNTTMHDARVSIAEKTRSLYTYACKVSEPDPEDEYRAPDGSSPHHTTHTVTRPQSFKIPYPVQVQSRKDPHPPEADQPPLLGLSCYAPQYTSYSCSATWFVRKHDKSYMPEKPTKRLLNTIDTEEPQGDGERRTKTRKIRKGKQCDVGSLLEMFGPP